MLIRCTKWLYPNELIKCGKVIFLYDNKEYYIVPEPKRIVKADIWCKEHADKIGGIIKYKGNRIAVFREI